MSIQDERKALYALSEERGGQLLLKHFRKAEENVHRSWTGLLRADPFPDKDLLMVQFLKHRADLAAARRVTGMLTDPSKERRDE